MKTVFGLAIVSSVICLSACSSTKTWRDHKATVSAFPRWNIEVINGEEFHSAAPSHNLIPKNHLTMHKDHKWGVEYEVLAEFIEAKAPRPEMKDWVSRDRYRVVKVLSEKPVGEGTCFNFGGDYQWSSRQQMTSKGFLKLFGPNTAKFKTPALEKKFERFLQDKESSWFRLNACFGMELEIVIGKVRYDQ